MTKPEDMVDCKQDKVHKDGRIIKVEKLNKPMNQQQKIDKIATEVMGYHKCGGFRPYCNCGDGEHNEPYRRDIDLDDWEIAGMVLEKMQTMDCDTQYTFAAAVNLQTEFSVYHMILGLTPGIIAEAALRAVE